MEEDHYSPGYRPAKKTVGNNERTGGNEGLSRKSIRPGFGSMAEESADPGLDLNLQLIMNRSATYFFRMKGDAMEQAGIYPGDLLIVDRAQKAANGKIIVASLEGELFIRRYRKTFNQLLLESDNPRHKTIEVGEFSRFDSWGVVTCVIHITDPSLQAWQSDHRSIRSAL